MMSYRTRCNELCGRREGGWKTDYLAVEVSDLSPVTCTGPAVSLGGGRLNTRFEAMRWKVHSEDPFAHV